MYLPKSKYQVLESSGEHYINPRTGDSYVGPYILTSEGAFIGSDITNLGPKLEPQQLNIPHKVYFTPSVSRYNLANDEESYYYINNTKPIVATKTKMQNIEFKEIT